ncbi:hypothetical protein CRG98_045259 [Punica granatum]|uniref:Uncharacterized protein n=1 Tax=Punica granatum TaxID=22663 RepID=A0A2I0HRX8_PUNGR|nr:hypothetical protein CRG98_045259 [Punica granatum]
MVSAECINVGLNTLFKAATRHGTSHHVFIVCIYAIGATAFLPASFVSYRSLSLCMSVKSAASTKPQDHVQNWPSWAHWGLIADDGIRRNQLLPSATSCLLSLSSLPSSSGSSSSLPAFIVPFSTAS